MARNGSGTFNLPQAAFVPDTTIEAAPMNSNLSDIGAALTQSISKDGQTAYTASQPMGNNKLTGLAAGTSATDSVNLGQVASGGLNYGTATGTDTIAVTLTPGFTAYAVGQSFSFIVAATNTGATTVNVNTIGAGALTWPDGTALAAGDLVTGALVYVEVKATTPVFHLQTVVKPTVGRAGGTITGATSVAATLTMSGAAFNEAVRVDVASATTCDIGAAASNYVRITGTTTITGLGTIASGARRKVVFGGILTLTHNATSLILPTGANITTAAGDCAEFESEGSGNWRCTSYQPATGAAVLPLQQYAQAYCTMSGTTITIQKQTGISSITRTAQGKVTVVMSPAMPDANYVVTGSTLSDPLVTTNSTIFMERTASGRTTTTFYLGFLGDNVAYQDPDGFSIRVYA